MVGGSEQLYNAAAIHNACAEGLWLSAKTSHAVSKSGKKAVSERTDQQCLSKLIPEPFLNFSPAKRRS